MWYFCDCKGLLGRDGCTASNLEQWGKIIYMIAYEKKLNCWLNDTVKRATQSDLHKCKKETCERPKVSPRNCEVSVEHLEAKSTVWCFLKRPAFQTTYSPPPLSYVNRIYNYQFSFTWERLISTISHWKVIFITKYYMVFFSPLDLCCSTWI